MEVPHSLTCSKTTHPCANAWPLSARERAPSVAPHRLGVRLLVNRVCPSPHRLPLRKEATA